MYDVAITDAESPMSTIPCSLDPGRKRYWSMDYFAPVASIPDMPDVVLSVPSIEDLQAGLRGLIRAGHPLFDAYAIQGIGDILPPAGMRPYLESILHTHFINRDTAADSLSSQFYENMCRRFGDAFHRYVIPAYMFWPITGRMVLTVGSEIGGSRYVPSPDEQLCIRQHIATGATLDTAYTNCGAFDILPLDPSAIKSQIAELMKSNPTTPMWHIMSAVYGVQGYSIDPDGSVVEPLYTIYDDDHVALLIDPPNPWEFAPPPPPPPEPPGPPVEPPVVVEKPFPTAALIIGGVALLVLSQT